MRTLILLLLLAVAAQADTILNSKHDLTVAGPGPIKAVTEREVCAFCHTPHRALEEGPLWSHALSTAQYTPYGSSTAKAAIGQPTGASKLCLSCHDGTVALGMVSSQAEPIAMQNEITTLPAGRTQIGTDLSDDHPVSFHYDAALVSANPELREPSTLVDRVRLDDNGQLQCTACHDPHNNQFGDFLVMNNNAGALCLACHQPNSWNTSIHNTSGATWNGVGSTPWPHTTEPTVAANACQSCHAPHDAGTPARLLNAADEEQNCYVCHNGNVAAQNIQAEFSKISTHPIDLTTGVHDPVEDPINSTRHVECVDCHDPHAAKTQPAVAPNASGALAGVTGVDKDRAIVTPLVREYELCFRCHADSGNRGAAHVNRQFPETNKRLAFQTSNASYHPIEAVGKNAAVPSLIQPLTVASVIYCTDCHNNDQGAGAGGVGPNGPHGSVHVPLLERELALADFQVENEAAYAMCYKCHSRESILNNQSFPLHRLHVVDNQTACTTCHDSHGVMTQTHLINFNRTFVTPSGSGKLEFTDGGQSRGTCALSCHGKDHDPATYGN